MKFSFGRPFTRLFRPRRPSPYRREAAPRCRPNLEGLESRVTPDCARVYWPAPYNGFVTFPANVIGVCNTNDSGNGSLRDAITFVNSQPPDRLYEIATSIPTPQVQQPHTIHLRSPLPPIHNSVIINAITFQLDYNRQPMVELDGSQAGSNANGLVLSGTIPRRTPFSVAGFIINNFGGSGLILQGAIGEVIFGNYIGTDATGTQSRPNSIGITVRNGGDHNKIVKNVISGNMQEGVLLTGTSVTRTVLNHNKIGTDYLGLNAVPNRGDGVVINQGASNNRLIFNVISGNTRAGVSVQDRTSMKNRLDGNHIGTNTAGTLRVPNATGVEVIQALDTIIGRPLGIVSQPGRRSFGNLISGNTVGINIINVQPILANGERGAIIRNNFIGTDLTGTASLANLQGGITVQNSIGTTIGSTDTRFPNVIAANGNEGILLSGGTSQSLIEGNFIGTDVTGTTALSNTIGVYIQGGINNTIGGTLPGAGNILAGNAAAGVTVVFSQSTGNVIEGNFIGTTDTVGTLALPNGVGVSVAQTAANTTIGGTDPMAGNYIFYNSTNGILISDMATGTLVQGNTIVGNSANGVAVVRASNNTIGTLDPGAANTITANGADGVLVDTGTGNLIEGNSISGHPRLGIELLNRGNLNQAAPTNLSASTDMNQITTVTGAISGIANANYTVDFYFDPVLDSNGFGEGETYAGTITVQTDSNGQGMFTAMINGSGNYLAATATDPLNNTSQFSVGAVVTGPGPSGGDGSGDPGNAVAAEAATLVQALGTPLNHNAAAVVWQGTAIVSPEDGGPARLANELLSLQGVGSLMDHTTGAPGRHHVLDAVFAAAPEGALDGTAGDGLFQSLGS